MKMSWISPTFGDDDDPLTPPPPKKRSTRERAEATVSQISFEIDPSAAAGGCDWLLRYRPKGVGDLAANVKKVKETESWLAQSFKMNSSKFLLLTGPSGCGKTATLHTLCKSLGIKVMEWITPLDKPDEGSEYPSMFEYSKSAVKKFEEYLLRSSRYGSCLTVGSSKKIVLVKDFPNAFLYNPTTFHDLLGTFVEKCLNPVVFVCSDDASCRRLFPANLKNNCRIQTVTFNPVTDQRMFKVLKSVLVHESKANKNVTVLADCAVNAISTSCQGDLRSAITTLYFHSVNSQFDLSRLNTKSQLKKASSSGECTPNKDDRLDFFRGIGRVLFPKRVESPRSLKFVHSSDSIADNFLSEPNGFISQLHENYPSKMGDIHDLADAAEKMAKCDVLLSRWQDKDIFRAYALSVAVRGLMACNRRPQKGRFEPFKRSTTSRLEMDSKALELEGKSLFSEMHILDYTSMIDILPFARTLLPDLNPSQLNYIQKTCRFKPF